MRWIVLRLSVVDAGRVDADHPNLATRDEPISGSRVETWKMQFRNGCLALLRRTQILRAIWPIRAKASANQHNAIFELRFMIGFPRLKILNGNLIVAIYGALCRDIHTYAGSDQALERKPVDGYSLFKEVDRCV